MILKKPFIITLLWLTLAGIGGALCLSAGMYLYLSPQLPSVDALRDVNLQTPLRVYSADNHLIAEFGEKRRTPIQYAEIPQTYINALLAAEDAEFFEHHGVSIKGLMRAATQLVLTGRRASGGSTITMQVARNYYLSRRKTFVRKFNEILLALRIEQELSKEEILELYVNVIFLGNRAYGIHAASQVYYGTSLSHLSLAQFAMLAGLPKGPSTMNPIANPTRALERRNWILGRMLALDMIDQDSHDRAIIEPVTASYHGSNVDVDAPYVAEMARAKAIELYGLDAYTEGYSVYTTVRSTLQNRAQKAVIDGLISYDGRHGYRGPEQQLEVPADYIEALNSLSTTTSDASEDSESANSSEPAEEKTPPSIEEHIQQFTFIEEWQKTLQNIPELGGLIPAAVIRLEEQAINLLLSDGKVIKLQWDDGLSSAAPYINENAVGSKPKTAADIVDIGDVVRLQKQNDHYTLSQTPDAQAALISLNPTNGAILSLVGGFDFNQSHFNRVTQAKRQPGSNFKPFIYTAALENGMTAATIINDAPIVFDDENLESTWRPENDGGRFDGPTRLRKALYRSRNLVSIRILQEIGIGNAIRGMSRFGFNEDELPRDLSLALGSHGFTPLEVVTGYAVFANGGYSVQPYLIERITDNSGTTVFEALPATVCDCDQPETEITPVMDDEFLIEGDPFALPFSIKRALGILEPKDYPRAERVLDDRVTYIIDSILQDVIRRGTGMRARALNRGDLAGKTGTTNGPIDAWFSGYNGRVVTTTWVGFDQNTKLGVREYGGSAALPIWIDYMGEALKNTPETTRTQPPGIVTVRIDPETGERARAGDPDAIFEIFREEQTPKLKDDTPAYSPYDNAERLTEDLF